MQHTGNTAGLAPVQVEPNGSGGADVWLRTNIRQTTDQDGSPMWEADEAHGVVSPAPAVEEVEADFDGWWQRLESEAEGEAERIARLTARLAEAEARADLMESALVELAGIVGGE